MPLCIKINTIPPNKRTNIALSAMMIPMFFLGFEATRILGRGFVDWYDWGNLGESTGKAGVAGSDEGWAVNSEAPAVKLVAASFTSIGLYPALMKLCVACSRDAPRSMAFCIPAIISSFIV